MKERFWNKLVEDSNGCWIWQGGKFHDGYGYIDYRAYRWRAHRLVYYLTHGSIPKGLVVMHLCNNKSCCNPEHLKAGTQSENLEQAGIEGKMTREKGPGVRSGLSEEDIEAIKRSALSNRALARKYGFNCHKTISAIRRGYYQDARRV